jgi:hypothetical protein
MACFKNVCRWRAGFQWSRAGLSFQNTKGDDSEFAQRYYKIVNGYGLTSFRTDTQRKFSASRSQQSFSAQLLSVRFFLAAASISPAA